jgi:hypothetical protein
MTECTGIEFHVVTVYWYVGRIWLLQNIRPVSHFWRPIILARTYDNSGAE